MKPELRAPKRRRHPGAFGHLARGGRVLAGTLVCLSLASCRSDADDDAAPESAEAPPVAGAPAADAAVQRQMELMAELRVIDQALAPLRARAQEDAEIHAQEQALIAEVDAAMESISPGVLESRERFETLRVEFAEAQQAGDEERAQTLGIELQGLQARLQQTQTAALAQEDVAASLETFRERLFAWMRAADPQADSLLDRAQEITDELERSMTPPSES